MKWKCRLFTVSAVVIGILLWRRILVSDSPVIIRAGGGPLDVQVQLLESSLRLMMDAQSISYPVDVLTYCNGIQTLTELRDTSSVEAKLSFDDKSQFKLMQVYLVLRHGDKMPTFAQSDVIPSPKLKCSFPTELPVDCSDLNRFKRIPLTEGLILDPILCKDSRDSCQAGMLTSYGYYQHYFKGQYLRQRYADLFAHTHQWNDSVFVHSTGFERTQQSAAAFLLGFLGGNTAHSVPIHVSKGITLYGLPPGSAPLYRWCPKVKEMINKEWSSGEFKSSQIFFANVSQRVAAVMNVSRFKLPPKITTLYDQLMSRACHGLPHLCGARGCIDSRLMEGVAGYANWYSTHSYPMGTAVLMMQPFIHNTLFQQMNKAIEKDKDGRDDYLKALVHFCHDSTLSSIMAALDVPQKKIMPYAGHITFELWKRETTDDSKKSDEESWYYSPYYVRILVNGNSVTHELQLSVADFELARELLKFRSWKEYISSGRFRSKDSYDEVCGLLPTPIQSSYILQNHSQV